MAAERALQGRSVAGLRAVVTGGTSGIGYFVCEALAKQGIHVILAARDEEKGLEAVRKIRLATGGQVSFETLELADLYSVSMFSVRMVRQYDKIDLLVLNAGMLAHTYEESEDGIEMTWHVNHVAGQALTMYLLPVLLSSKESRVVAVASSGHYSLDFLSSYAHIFNVRAQPMPRESWNQVSSYGASKAANILMAREIAQRYGDRGMRAFSVHPGFVATEFATPRINAVQASSQSAFVKWFLLNVVAPSTRLFWKWAPTTISATQGAGVVLYPCLNENASLKVNGEYFSVIGGPINSSAATMNLTTAKELWDATELLLLTQEYKRRQQRAKRPR